jgi:hypothetical protein
LYDKVYINRKGYLTFQNSANESVINSIPSAIVPNNYIAFLANDTRFINHTTKLSYARVKGWGDQEEKTLVITFYNLSNMVGDAQMDIQILLSELGDIRIQYNNIDTHFNLDNYLVGIENIDGTDGLQYQYNLGRLRDSLAVEFRYPGRDNFSEMFPENNTSDEVSTFADFTWLPPRKTDSVKVYLAESSETLDENTIVYEGDRILKFDPELTSNTFYNYKLQAILTNGDVITSPTFTFKTMRDVINVEGTVYIEDSVTVAPFTPLSIESNCLMQGKYTVYDTTDAYGNFSIGMPACPELILETNAAGCENSKTTVFLNDTTSDGNTILQDVYITTNPVFTSFTFNADEITELADSILYFSLTPAKWFWSRFLKDIRAEASFPPGVTCSIDFDTVSDYSHPVKLELTTIGGVSKEYTIRHNVLAGFGVLSGETDYGVYNGAIYFGNYLNISRWTLDLNNEGESCWEDKKMTMCTDAPQFVSKTSKGWVVGMAPGNFTISPTDPEYGINMVKFTFHENCGEGCSSVQAFRNNKLVESVIPDEIETKTYTLSMYDDPASRIVMSSYESEVRDIQVWIEKGEGNPLLSTRVICDGNILRDTLAAAVEIFKQDDVNTQDWELVRPLIFNKGGKSWAKLVPGKYIVRAIPANPDSINFNPTYSGDEFTWDEAEVITLTHYEEKVYDINCSALEALAGSNTIQGTIQFADVTQQKSTAQKLGLNGYRVMLFDAETQEILDYTLTDPEGIYVFNNVPSGKYYIMTEKEEMDKSPNIFAELTGDNEKLEVPEIFYFHLNNAVITLKQDLNHINGASFTSLKIYPNPASGEVFIDQDVESLVIFSVSGKPVVKLENVSKNMAINVNELETGYYIIKALTRQGICTSALIIK